MTTHEIATQVTRLAVQVERLADQVRMTDAAMAVALRTELRALAETEARIMAEIAGLRVRLDTLERRHQARGVA